MAIATAPQSASTRPTIPNAKPSQILRSVPADRWCTRHITQVDDSSRPRFCAVGRLADEGGFDWSDWDGLHDQRSNAARFVRRTYGLKPNQIVAVMYRNDAEGLDVVIDFLERRGL